jgi:hypothetical protein
VTRDWRELPGYALAPGLRVDLSYRVHRRWAGIEGVIVEVVEREGVDRHGEVIQTIRVRIQPDRWPPGELRRRALRSPGRPLTGRIALELREGQCLRVRAERADDGDDDVPI